MSTHTLSRNRFKAFANTKPVSMPIHEHRETADRLRRIAGELRSVRELLRNRYPDSARCRSIASSVDADVATLRLTMAGVVNSEMPSAGVNYMTNV